jgi:crossover junction endodeoxyribonuclease RuvC
VRILGLDPGLVATGWGVIEAEGNRLTHVAHGVVRPVTTADLATRLAFLSSSLAELIALHAPEEAAVEEVFVNVNPASTLKLGMARGVVMLAPAASGLPVAEYAARLVKQACVGTGRAEKSQVAMMVARLLPGCDATADAADALAVAICHAHHRQTAQKWSEAPSPSHSPAANGPLPLPQGERGVARARALRRDSTDAEQVLWRHLRNRQAEAKFRRQQPIGPYIADFVSFEHRLIVEVDGGQHATSATDPVRTAFLERAGFRVVRFWNNDVLANIEGVLARVAASICCIDPSPLAGEGGARARQRVGG